MLQHTGGSERVDAASADPVAGRWIRDQASGAPVLIRPQSNQLVFMYAGLAQRLASDPMVLFAKARLLERNLVMFQDNRRAYYQAGVSTRIDTFERFVERQRELCRELTHVKRLFCFGSSMGAYAAILFGRLLDAEEVWALSPQTLLDPVLSDELQLPASRRDLAELLKRGNGRTRYNVYYNASYRQDAEAAQRLAGVEGVVLYPQGGEGHAVINTLMKNDMLRTLLPEPS